MNSVSDSRHTGVHRAFGRSCWLDTAKDQSLAKHRIRGVSETGATVVCTRPDLLPDDFNLYFSRDRRDRRGCKVVWRSNHELGVTFLRSAA
jgi:hypothetical protein